MTDDFFDAFYDAIEWRKKNTRTRVKVDDSYLVDEDDDEPVYHRLIIIQCIAGEKAASLEFSGSIEPHNKTELYQHWQDAFDFNMTAQEAHEFINDLYLLGHASFDKLYMSRSQECYEVNVYCDDGHYRKFVIKDTAELENTFEFYANSECSTLVEETILRNC